MTDLEEDYFSKGGVIHYAPPAFAAPTLQANNLSLRDKEIIRQHDDEQELLRKGKFKVRMELRHARPQNHQGERQGDNQDRRESTDRKDTKEKAPDPETEVSLSGLGTTRLHFLSASGEEITIRRFPDGRSEVHNIDHQGRDFLIRFGKNQQYQGTEWRNKAAFEGVNLK